MPTENNNRTRQGQDRKTMADLLEGIPLVGKAARNLYMRRGSNRSKLTSIFLVLIVAGGAFAYYRFTAAKGNSGIQSNNSGKVAGSISSIIGNSNTVYNAPVTFNTASNIYTGTVNINTTEPKSESKEQKEQQRLKGQLLAELDDPIRQVFLVLRLTETNRFLSLCPLDGGVQVLKMGNSGKLTGFNARFQDGGMTMRDGQNQIIEVHAVYAVSVVMKSEGTNGAVKRRRSGTTKTSIKTMGIPIPLWMLGDAPFRTLRDLNKSKIIVSVSTNVTSRLERVELVVNGWSILNLETKGADWFYSTILQPPFDPNVNLHTLTVPPTYGNTPSWTGTFVDFHNSIMKYYPDAATPLTLNDTEAEVFIRTGQIYGHAEPDW